MFLLVPAYPGCPRQTAVKWLLLFVVGVSVCKQSMLGCTHPGGKLAIAQSSLRRPTLVSCHPTAEVAVTSCGNISVSLQHSVNENATKGEKVTSEITADVVESTSVIADNGYGILIVH